MKFAKSVFSVFLCLSLNIVLLPSVLTQSVSAQSADLGIALQRGYRTGYSDGYMSGYRDTIDSLDRNYTRHEEYARADRAYSKDYGPIEDYRDGYQQGFEAGYNTGFEKRSFESTLPDGIKKRGVITVQTQSVAAIPDNSVAADQTAAAAKTTDDRVVAAKTADNQQVPVAVENTATGIQTNSNAIIIIPRDTELLLQLDEDLSTDRSRTGEKFTAKVVSPSEIAGATIEGRVSKITAPGRIKRRSELSLSFDRIILDDTRWSNFSATLTEVMPVKGDNIKLVDTEGTAIGQSSLRGDVIKIGGATGAGLVTGAVVGGPVGAAVGAGMGAAFGVGAVVIDRGKHIRLNRNQQLRIKTEYETKIR